MSMNSKNLRFPRQGRNPNPPSIQDLLKKATAAKAAQDAGEDPGISEEDVKKFLALTKQELNVLALIASGNPPRNSQAILSAIKLKLEYTVKRADQPANATTPVTVVVKTYQQEPT